ncbi:MAG: ABC transporter ATP-binding protein [Chloroflexales bacterium]|nr:ABC transporter ATP-binding protein [Chloroflexales bacterium]
MTSPSESTRRRRIRWGVRGALTLAALAIMLGGLFNVLITIFEGAVPPDAGVGYWAGLLLWSSLVWGGGGLFFGTLLGVYASMIWRDDSGT